MRLFGRHGHREAEIDEELRAHLEARVEHLVARGMTPDAARAEALRRFGDLERGRDAIRDAARSSFRIGWTDVTHDFAHDIRYVARGLLRSPTLTLGVTATLALGLGINTAVFRVADFALFRAPAGVARPGDLRWLESSISIGGGAPMKATVFSYPDAAAVVGAGAFAPAAMYVLRAGHDADGRDLALCYVDDGYVPTLGLRLSAGRAFTPQETRPGSDRPAAIVSDRYWRDRFGAVPLSGDASVTLAGRRYPIVGVMPKAFTGVDLDPIDVWLPLGVGDFGSGTVNGVPITWYQTDMLRAIHVIGRLPASGAETATADQLSAAFAALRPGDTDVVRRAVLHPIVPVGGASLSTETRTLLAELSVVAVVILAIACANAVNLLLARGLRRRQEIAIRLAIGASRVRVSRLLMIESLMLATLGGTAALIAGLWTSEALRRLLFPDAKWTASPADDRTLIATGLLTLAIGVIAGLVPAAQTTAPDLVTGLKREQTRGGGRTAVTRAALVVAQTALSLTLLIASGLLVRSLVKLNQVPLGFDQAGLVTASFESGVADRRPGPGLQATDMAARLAATAADRVQATAGASVVPFGSTSVMTMKVIGSSYTPPDRELPRWAAVDGGYFRLMRTRAVWGRVINGDDTAGSEPVAVINETMAKQYFDGPVPPNACIQTSGLPCLRIVGVVEDVRDTPSGGAPPMRYYLPLAQEGNGAKGLLVRTSADQAHGVAAEMRAMVPAGQRVTIEVVSDRVARALRPWRTATWLFGMLGVLALALACLGVYSVMNYVASERTQEMGMRLVLGATGLDVVRLIVGNGVKLAFIGAFAGILVSAIASHYLSALLFGVSPFDPATYIGAAASLIVASAAAVLSPALRASRVDPVTALRHD